MARSTTQPPTHAYRIALSMALVAMTFLATTPIDYQIISFAFIDKLEHLSAFLVLAFLMDFAFPAAPWNRQKFFLLLCYGLLLEIVQYFMPFREFSLWDLAADALGLLSYPLVTPLLKSLPFLAPRWME